MDQNTRPNEGIIITGGTINAQQLAVGRHAKAFQTITQAEDALAQKGLVEIQAKLDALKEALTQNGGSLQNQDEVMGATEQVAQELTKEKPNKLAVVGILSGIAQSVNSVTAVATAVHGLTAAVSAFL